jgi:hypothetical protein
MTMSNVNLSKLLVAGLLLGAGAAQAAVPTSVSEVPAAWYADQITTPASTRGATNVTYPTAAYEHGAYGQEHVEVNRTSTQPSVASRIIPFPSSPNESGPVL